MNILITGANGFIGRNLCAFLKKNGCHVRVAVRAQSSDIAGVDEYVIVNEVGPETDWTQALSGVDIVVHLAARVHVLKKPGPDPLELFRKINVLGTERLARMAAQAGIKKFIFISSSKVNGEGALSPYTEKDTPAPQDAYGISKKEAEDSLGRVANQTGLATVILRLPLVYGPGVKANFHNLIKIVRIGLPLPFKKINNRRSFLYLGNLLDVIVTCINHPAAAGETFLVSDGQDISTADLIKMIASAMNKKAALFYLPSGILEALCKISGKTEELNRLTGSLFVDSSKIKNRLGWKPPFTLEQGIRETVSRYRA